MKIINKFQITLLTLFFLVSFNAFGFWIGFGPVDNIHQGITAKAAKEYMYTPSSNKYNDLCTQGKEKKSCTFTDPVIEILEKNNKSIDGGSTKDDPAYHCDDEEIYACSRIIFGNRRVIVKDLRKLVATIKNHSVNTHDIKTAQEILGKVSHTLQDFYSHSNWVERQEYGTAGSIKTPYDVGQIKNIPVPKDEDIHIYEKLMSKNFKYQKVNAKVTCIIDVLTATSPGTTLFLDSIFTGYYHETPDIYGFKSDNSHFYSEISSRFGANFKVLNAPYFTNWSFKEIILPGVLDNTFVPAYLYQVQPTNPIEKCQHGDWSNNTRFGSNEHFGIAKDQPNRSLHNVAKAYAIKATKLYVEAIVDDIKNIEGSNEAVDKAILLFLGHHQEAIIKTEVNALHHGGCRTRNGGPGNAEDTNWQTCNVLSLQCEENASCAQLMSGNTLADSEVQISKTASRNDLDEFCQDTQYLHSGFADAYAQLNGDALLRGLVKVEISAGSDFCASSWSNSSARSELSDTITIVGGDIAPNPVLVLHFDVSSTLSPAKTNGWPSDTEVQFKQITTNGKETIICSRKKYQSISLNNAGEVVNEITDEGEFSFEECKVFLAPINGRRTFEYRLALQVNALNSKGGTSSSIASVRLSKITFVDEVTTPESIGARIEFSSGISSPN